MRWWDKPPRSSTSLEIQSRVLCVLCCVSCSQLRSEKKGTKGAADGGVTNRVVVMKFLEARGGVRHPDLPPPPPSSPPYIRFLQTFICNHHISTTNPQQQEFYTQLAAVYSSPTEPEGLYCLFIYSFSHQPLQFFHSVNKSLFHSFKTIVGPIDFFFLFLRKTQKPNSGITGAC